MFVVWRRKPVKGRAGCAFLAGDPPSLWRHNLQCDHGGADRVAWTPLLMHSVRVDGKPRQKLVKRLATIRSCCIADPFTASAWWHHFDDLADAWREPIANPAGGGMERFARDEATIRAKLLEVVPIPRGAARRKFDGHVARMSQGVTGQGGEAEVAIPVDEMLGEELRKAEQRRVQVGPVEQARIWDRLMRTQKLTHQELADRLGYAQATISRMVVLLKLPESIQRDVDSGAISAAVGYYISRVDDPAEQAVLAAQAKVGTFTIKGARDRVAKARKAEADRWKAIRAKGGW